MGNNLRIDSIGIHDGGKYSCEAEVEATEPLAVVHIVEILGEDNQREYHVIKRNSLLRPNHKTFRLDLINN